MRNNRLIRPQDSTFADEHESFGDVTDGPKLWLRLPSARQIRRPEQLSSTPPFDDEGEELVRELSRRPTDSSVSYGKTLSLYF